MNIIVSGISQTVKGFLKMAVAGTNRILRNIGIWAVLGSLHTLNKDAKEAVRLCVNLTAQRILLASKSLGHVNSARRKRSCITTMTTQPASFAAGCVSFVIAASECSGIILNV